MDPVTQIVSAMVLGLSAGASAVATSGVKDAYTSLKDLIAKRFAHDARAGRVLADFEEDPEVYEKALAKQIKAAGLDKDAEVLGLAEKVEQLSIGAGVRSHFQTIVTGNAKIGIVGDKGHINTMN